MEDSAYEELKRLRNENKNLKKLLKPFLSVARLITEYGDSKEDFNSYYSTEIYNREYDFMLDGPLLEDFIKLYQEFNFGR